MGWVRRSGRIAREAGLLVAESVATRVHEALQAPFDLGGVEFFTSASIGVSLFPQDATDATALLKNADTAMYQSKKAAPGGYIVYASGSDEAIERLSLTTRLRRAVEQKHWVLYWQPIVELDGGTVTGLEALIRWREPNGGIVPPGEFIPIAEELGLIEAIGDWVIDELARQRKVWEAQGIDVRLGFNLSPRQLWSGRLAEKLTEKLAAAEVNPHDVVVEITESTAMADPDRTQRVLADLHAWGLTLAIDDFGTGYSSLARLKHLPVDILKIDRSFIHDVDSDEDSRRHGRGHDPARPRAGHGAPRGGDRDGRGARLPQGRGMHARSGVPVRPAGARRRDPRAARTTDAVRGPLDPRLAAPRGVRRQFVESFLGHLSVHVDHGGGGLRDRERQAGEAEGPLRR